MSHYQNKQNQTNPFGSEIISSTWIMAAENIFLHGNIIKRLYIVKNKNDSK